MLLTARIILICFQYLSLYIYIWFLFLYLISESHRLNIQRICLLFKHYLIPI